MFRYAVITKKAKLNIAADLKGALQATAPQHRVSITNPKRVGGLLRRLDTYEGSFQVACALPLPRWYWCAPVNCAGPNGRKSTLTQQNDAYPPPV